MRARILGDSGDVILQVDADVRTSTRGGLKTWYGSFVVDAPSTLGQKDEYRIELADGRSGKILIKRKTVSTGTGRTAIEFLGTGPLAEGC